MQSSKFAPNLRIKSLQEGEDTNTHLSGVSLLKTKEKGSARTINELLVCGWQDRVKPLRALETGEIYILLQTVSP